MLIERPTLPLPSGSPGALTGASQQLTMSAFFLGSQDVAVRRVSLGRSIPFEWWTFSQGVAA